MSADNYKILMREGEGWRQYLVVADEKVFVVHMTPAVFGGWRIGRIDAQGADQWPGMSRDAIVAWKLANDDGRTRVVEQIEAGFLARLIARVEGAPGNG